MTKEIRLNDKNLQELYELLGMKEGRKFGDVFEEAVKEVHDERKAAKKEIVKQHICKLLELSEQQAKLLDNFLSTYSRNEKDIGKVINRLKGMIGRTPPEDEHATDAGVDPGDDVDQPA
jgi:translation initiation factor 2 alpha subunit (eIF-2alpha)